MTGNMNTTATRKREANYSKSGRDVELRIAKMQGFSYADFILTRGERDGVAQGAAFCEIRVRSTPKDKFPTIFITLNKYKNMLMMSEFTGLKSFFVVQWSDQCGYVELTKENEGTTFPKRRKPKGDDHHDEPCVLLAVDKFTKLWDGQV